MKQRLKHALLTLQCAKMVKNVQTRVVQIERNPILKFKTYSAKIFHTLKNDSAQKIFHFTKKRKEKLKYQHTEHTSLENFIYTTEWEANDLCCINCNICILLIVTHEHKPTVQVPS